MNLLQNEVLQLDDSSLIKMELYNNTMGLYSGMANYKECTFLTIYLHTTF